MKNLVTSFPPGTGLDYDYGDLVKALCTSTDWIDKPTDIASKITKLQDFLIPTLRFFYPWSGRKRIPNTQWVNMICILKKK